jgi:hypothetical protein
MPGTATSLYVKREALPKRRLLTVLYFPPGHSPGQLMCETSC